MPAITREIIKGLASGVGFLIFAFVLDVPTLLAIGIAAGLYVGLSFVLPKAPAVDNRSAAPGLSMQERDAFLSECRKSTASLGRLADSVRKHPFCERIKGLAKTANDLTDYLEKKPDAILMAYAVPRNLDHLTSMLQQYVTISNYQQAGDTAGEALRKVEDIFQEAEKSFTGMYQQLLDNDVAALEASAHTLEILMTADAQVSGQKFRANNGVKTDTRQAPKPQPEKER
jgi:hypothetical protein